MTLMSVHLDTARPADAALIGGLKAPASAKAVLLALVHLRDGTLSVTLPEGKRLVFGDGKAPSADIIVRDYRFANRVILNGDIGFAEGWMSGEWDTSDLTTLLVLLANNIERFRRVFEGNLIGKSINWIRHLSRDNSKSGARRNILEHYDLGNAFYASWLDPSMTYSSARFDRAERDLSGAQQEKYRSLAEHLDLQPGEHVLEIGCGWGGFAEYAAREHGARVTGITISDEQLHYAQRRIADAGLSDRVEIRRQDYRDVEGQYDKVASIEMFEAVGEKYWQTYFNKIASVLKPAGRAALQIITIRDDLFDRYRRRADFIQRYVFPGGMLASMPVLERHIQAAGLRVTQIDAFGQSYAQTLADWAAKFRSRWTDIRELGFDERFKQFWLFYLSYCEAGFKTGRTDVIQIAASR